MFRTSKTTDRVPLPCTDFCAAVDFVPFGDLSSFSAGGSKVACESLACRSQPGFPKQNQGNTDS